MGPINQSYWLSMNRFEALVAMYSGIASASRVTGRESESSRQGVGRVEALKNE
jgi:hypothetical protein